MTVEALAKLGQQVREAQRQYFRHRTPDALAASKALEKRFDQACKETLEQPGLFGKEDEP